MKLILLILTICLISITSARSVVVNRNELGSSECEFCEMAVGYVENLIINSNKTQSEIIQELEKMCKFVSPNVKNTCDSLISVYADEIIKLIFAKENPKSICTQIKICTTTTNSSVDELINKFKEFTRPLNKNHIVQQIKTPKCDMCETFVSKIESYISTNKTEDEIMQELNNACQYVKGFEEQCKQMVADYVPEIIELMDTTENPNQVCAQLQLCPQPSSPSSKTKITKNILRINKNY